MKLHVEYILKRRKNQGRLSIFMSTASCYLLILTLQCLSHRAILFGCFKPVLLQYHVQIMSITNHRLSTGLHFVTNKFVDKL